MKTCRLYIPLYEWNVTAFFDATAEDEAVIVEELQYIRCPRKTLARVSSNLSRDLLDTGFTYSNRILRESVMTVGRASDPREFLNSFVHELRHLVDDIAYTSHLPMRGETVGYLSGELSWEFMNEVADYLCCKCHHD